MFSACFGRMEAVPEEGRMMVSLEWSKAVCKVDGRLLRAWLEKYAPQTGATQKQIDKIVGLTGPQRGPKEQEQKS